MDVNVNGPGTTYDITGGSLVGATGSCTLAGLTGIGGWSGSSTNTPNGTYTFSFYSIILLVSNILLNYFLIEDKLYSFLENFINFLCLGLIYFITF